MEWLTSLKDIGYQHQIVGSKELSIAHLVISLLKRWLLGTYQGAVRPEHLSYYLDEFTFRFNRRTSSSRGQLFYRLIQQALAVDPLPGKEIVVKSQRLIDKKPAIEIQDIPF